MYSNGKIAGREGESSFGLTSAVGGFEGASVDQNSSFLGAGSGIDFSSPNSS